MDKTEVSVMIAEFRSLAKKLEELLTKQESPSPTVEGQSRHAAGSNGRGGWKVKTRGWSVAPSTLAAGRRLENGADTVLHGVWVTGKNDGKDIRFSGRALLELMAAIFEVQSGALAGKVDVDHGAIVRVRPDASATLLVARSDVLKIGDYVTYKDAECEVIKVSGDGTSLTLEDEDGEIHKGVGPEEVISLKVTG